MKRSITPDDIMPLDQYAKLRGDIRRSVIERKKNRMLHVGPYATAQFENYETMWQQVHEMLYTEKGGPDQVAGELAAYNPLIPNGHDLVATVMLEIEDPVRRARLLAGLGGIETAMVLMVSGERVQGIAEGDLERSDASGRTSSVHFIHFPFTAEQIVKFRKPGAQIALAIEHANYNHAAIMPEAMRSAVAEDFE
jgi:hypothetical protein